MTWMRHIIILIVLICATESKEETKKALIIAVDELKPEQSDVIISDVTIKDKRTSKSFQADESAPEAEIFKITPIDKKLDYIIVRPEDIKSIKNLDGVTVDSPKLLSYPESGSGESYESSRYTPYSREPYSTDGSYGTDPDTEPRSRTVKYPNKPAPPLVTHSEGDRSSEEPVSHDAPYLQKNYPVYDSQSTPPYRSPHSYERPKIFTITGIHGAPYGYAKLLSYSDAPRYFIHGSTYGSSKPSTYISPGSYYGSSQPDAYSSHSSYRKPKPGSSPGPVYYGGSKPSTYSSQNTYSGPSSYGTKTSINAGTSPYEDSKPISYSGHSTYAKPKGNSYYGPSTYESSKPSSYSGPSSYDSSKSSSYPGHSTYENSKPNTYSGPSEYDSPKSSSYPGSSTYKSSRPGSYSDFSNNENPSSYTGPSTYDHQKPGSYYGHSTYENPKLNSYSGPSTSENPNSSSFSGSPTYGSSYPNTYTGPSAYESLKPSSHSEPSAYEQSTYENPKPSTYSGPSDYGSSGPSTYSGPPSYKSSKSNSYSDKSSYPGSEISHSKSSPISSSKASSYSPPSSSHSSYNPGYSSKLSKYHYDSPTEKTHSKKHISTPEGYSYPDKAYSYDYYEPATGSKYESVPYHAPNKSYGKRYNSPLVKHVSYDDLPSPHKTSSGNEYEVPNSHNNEDSPNIPSKSPYSDNKNPISHDSYYHESPPYRHQYSTAYDKEPNPISYHSGSNKPSYGDKIYDASPSPITYKQKSTYNSSPYHNYPITSYTKKYPYDAPKPSYENSHDPSSYEEPESYKTYRYPSSKVTYDSPTSKYKHSTTSSPNIESGYHSTYNSPTSVTDSIKYNSSPSKFEEPPHSQKTISSSNYDHPSTYDSHSSPEYGARYPSSYISQTTNSKNPVTSHFTSEDAQSPQNGHYYEPKPRKGSTESHSHYHYDDSSEIPDSHSAKRNYSPVRPAPTQDQLEQPRYPPLPRPLKKTKDKYYESNEENSKENNENYEPLSSYKATKSFDPDSYSDYKGESHSYGETEKSYPPSGDNHNYHYSDHSSEETDNEPVVYTQTSTTTYRKQYKDPSTENTYITKEPHKTSYEQFTNKFPIVKSYSSSGKNIEVSQPEYSRPVYRSSGSSPAQHLHSYSYKREKPTVNTSMPIAYSTFSGGPPYKRVQGVVYRSRQSYPNIKTYRKHKGYLPYKPYYAKSTSAHDHKSVPSEIRVKNMTRDLPIYDFPKKIVISEIHKKQIDYASSESKEDSDGSTSISNHDAIPGKPGKDYPVLKEVPYNHFSCENKLPGFYADVENRCQVYYQCDEESRMQSFLCPNGTIFNQLTFVCEWWHNVDCSKSEKYFSKNNQLYKTSLPKIKRTVNDNYGRSSVEMEDSKESLSYITDEKEFHLKNNVRIPRKISHGREHRHS